MATDAQKLSQIDVKRSNGTDIVGQEEINFRKAAEQRLAREKANLSAAEYEQYEHEVTDFLTHVDVELNQVKQKFDTLRSKVSATAKSKGEALKGDAEIARAKANAQSIIGGLKSTNEKLAVKIQGLSEKEQSYWNFVSAENWLGLSARFLDGNTVSGMRLQCYKELAARTNATQAQLATVIQKLDEGVTLKEIQTIPTLAPFFVSPEGKLFLDRMNGVAGEEAYYVNMAQLYKNMGLPLVAESYYDRLEKEYPNTNYKPERMEKWRRFRDDNLTNFANDFLSLDQLAVMVAGWAIGRGIGAIAGKSVTLSKAAIATEAAIESSNMGSLLVRAIPGVQVIKSSAGESLVVSGIKGIANIALDVGKFVAYSHIAEEIGGEEAGKAVRIALMLIPGAKAGFESQMGASMAKNPRVAGEVSEWMLQKYGPAQAEKMIGDGLVKAAEQEAMKTGRRFKGLTLEQEAVPRDVAKRTVEQLQAIVTRKAVAKAAAGEVAEGVRMLESQLKNTKDTVQQIRIIEEIAKIERRPRSDYSIVNGNLERVSGKAVPTTGPKTTVSATSSTKTEAEINAMKEELKNMKQESGNYQGVGRDEEVIKALESDIQKAEKAVKDIESARISLDAKILDKQKEIDKLKSELAKMKRDQHAYAEEGGEHALAKVKQLEEPIRRAEKTIAEKEEHLNVIKKARADASPKVPEPAVPEVKPVPVIPEGLKLTATGKITKADMKAIAEKMKKDPNYSPQFIAEDGALWPQVAAQDGSLWSVRAIKNGRVEVGPVGKPADFLNLKIEDFVEKINANVKKGRIVDGVHIPGYIPENLKLFTTREITALDIQNVRNFVNKDANYRPQFIADDGTIWTIRKITGKAGAEKIEIGPLGQDSVARRATMQEMVDGINANVRKWREIEAVIAKERVSPTPTPTPTPSPVPYETAIQKNIQRSIEKTEADIARLKQRLEKADPKSAQAEQLASDIARAERHLLELKKAQAREAAPLRQQRRELQAELQKQREGYKALTPEVRKAHIDRLETEMGQLKAWKNDLKQQLEKADPKSAQAEQLASDIAQLDKKIASHQRLINALKKYEDQLKKAPEVPEEITKDPERFKTWIENHKHDLAFAGFLVLVAGVLYYLANREEDGKPTLTPVPVPAPQLGPIKPSTPGAPSPFPTPAVPSTPHAAPGKPGLSKTPEAYNRRSLEKFGDRIDAAIDYLTKSSDADERKLWELLVEAKKQKLSPASVVALQKYMHDTWEDVNVSSKKAPDGYFGPMTMEEIEAIAQPGVTTPAAPAPGTSAPTVPVTPNAPQGSIVTTPGVSGNGSVAGAKPPVEIVERSSFPAAEAASALRAEVREAVGDQTKIFARFASATSHFNANEKNFKMPAGLAYFGNNFGDVDSNVAGFSLINTKDRKDYLLKMSLNKQKKIVYTLTDTTGVDYENISKLKESAPKETGTFWKDDKGTMSFDLSFVSPESK